MIIESELITKESFQLFWDLNTLTVLCILICQILWVFTESKIKEKNPTVRKTSDQHLIGRKHEGRWFIKSKGCGRSRKKEGDERGWAESNLKERGKERFTTDNAEQFHFSESTKAPKPLFFERLKRERKNRKKRKKDIRQDQDAL